ncbi:TRAF-like protein [Pseudocohnilembus persalinus]|uniref:TRAF-like protein n=1 Tax=Pseudocohnilembus persalinus TaxID=266149 RepID=A0A0V0QFC3_PSEPJ|nr:TRAF-like protein [Pseudocohnilembus persalinus]|eukprot:KRX00890.1 TRAF-like protein [Pseudocohnilembus persalinus]
MENEQEEEMKINDEYNLIENKDFGYNQKFISVLKLDQIADKNQNYMQFICNQCQQIAENPKQCVQCQKIQCENCLEHQFYKQFQAECSNCGNKGKMNEIFKKLEVNLLGKLYLMQFRCINSQKGCNKLIYYKLLRHHQEDCCNYRIIKCTNYLQCKFQGYFLDVISHESNKCPFSKNAQLIKKSMISDKQSKDKNIQEQCRNCLQYLNSEQEEEQINSGHQLFGNQKLLYQNKQEDQNFQKIEQHQCLTFLNQKVNKIEKKLEKFEENIDFQQVMEKEQFIKNCENLNHYLDEVITNLKKKAENIEKQKVDQCFEGHLLKYQKFSLLRSGFTKCDVCDCNLLVKGQGSYKCSQCDFNRCELCYKENKIY